MPCPTRPPPSSSVTTPTSLLAAINARGHIHIILGAGPSSSSSCLAATRVNQSLAAGAKPVLVFPGPLANDALMQHVAEGRVVHMDRPFRAEQDILETFGRAETGGVVDAVFVVSPSSSGGGAGEQEEDLKGWTAQAVAELCGRHRVPVNVVDVPALSSFSLLSVHADGPVQVGVTTNGMGCKLAARIRREVAGLLPKGLGEAVGRLGEARRRVIGGGGEDEDESTGQSAAFNKLVKGRCGDEAATKTRRMRWLAQACEYWPLRRLARITDEDLEALLRAYEQGQADEAMAQGRRAGGTVILAGSGPGHPDLVTRLTLKAIHAADLVLADKLVPAAVLDLVPRRTEIVIARKFPGNAAGAQAELQELALAGSRAGKTVLRLKQGDPFLYGRGGEEVLFLRSKGVGDVRVLPAVTSALAGPLVAGIPGTQRDVADQVLVCTGTGKKGKAPDPPGYLVSRTTVFLMALHRIAGLVTQLTSHVPAEMEREKRVLFPPATPCAVVERASCPDQRVIRTTLEYVVAAVESEGSRPPGLLVVGRACEALWPPVRATAPSGSSRRWFVEDGLQGLDLDDLAPGVGLAGLA